MITCKSKKLTTNFTNLYFISVTFRTCLFSPLTSFNDEKKGTVQVLQELNWTEEMSLK